MAAAGKGAKALETILKIMTQNGGFDRVLQGFKVLEGGAGACVAEIEVGKEHLNKGGSLHGGFTATAVDVISTCALMTQGDGVPGVSVDLHVTYLKAARPGDKVIFDATTIKAGKTLAFLKVDVKDKLNGDIIARGSHTKYIGRK
ncbi:hypothetical protein R5R35_012648 [Gryllus longicercus]|uniref:Thioesterase domain-containing protein n=1 Tax=Gryllus longicercus TaxID=2509291 RepID=A0AAN9V0R1_9ORTH|nr:uncharacterized protein GBIM_16098 [Gryllus bimaculatus]